MIFPPRCEIMYGATARVTLNTPVDVGADHVVHVGIGKPRQRAVADHARIVDQDVDATGAVGDALDRGGARRRVTDVDLLRRNRLRRRLPCRDHRLRGFRVAAIEERDVDAFRGQQRDDGAADAAAAARHDRGLAGEARGDGQRHGSPCVIPEIANPPSTTSVWPLIIAASGRHNR